MTQPQPRPEIADTPDVASLYSRAASDTRAYVADTRREQWGDPTPCEGWDVRDVVMDAIDLTFERRSITGVCKDQMCAYLLIVEMRLSEQAVATFLRESPSKVYGMSTSIKLQLDDKVLRQCMERCKDAVVRAIDSGRT